MTQSLTIPEYKSESGGRGSCRASDHALPKRQHLSHGIIEVHNQPTIIFVTIATKKRERWLTIPHIPELIHETWTEATGWAVGRYVIMPDHVHFFCSPGTMEVTLEDWITYWKSQLRKKQKNANSRWLSDHWDTRMRSHQSYEEKWIYTQNNPVRHKLVTDSSLWPYQGEIHELRWS